MNKYKKLKDLILDENTLVVPDAYDGISAKLIEFVGFQAVQCSGYSISISKKYSNETNLKIQENLQTTEEIVSATKLPVFADGEDGYGFGETFEQNIYSFIKTGISGINIEDQNFNSDNCTNPIVEKKEMINKIEIINKIKKSLDLPYFILNSRTDALGAHSNRAKGLKYAIERANIYLDSGADIAFITNVKTKEEIKLLNKEINGPISITAGLQYNINSFNINDCREIGIARVSLPSTLILSSLAAQLKTLNNIKQSGNFDSIVDSLIDIEVFKEIMK